LPLVVVGCPGCGYVAFVGGERGDLVDVYAGGDEEDSLDGVGREGEVGCRVDVLHAESRS
jgi:hypothetical protein